MSQSTILVVEDNDKNRKLMRDVLSFAGYDVITAESAEEGVVLARTRKPSLVLMDLQLPGMDGLAALHELRGSLLTRGIPVVAVTAFAMEDDRKHALAAGFDGYVTKPVSIKTLPALVESFITRDGEET